MSTDRPTINPPRPEWMSEVPPVAPARPTINVHHRPVLDILADIWAAILASPYAAKILVGPGDTLYLDGERMYAVEVNTLLRGIANYVKVRPDGSTKPAEVPANMAGLILARPHPSLHRVERVVYAPTFLESGELLGDPGYHAASRILYQDDSSVLARLILTESGHDASQHEEAPRLEPVSMTVPEAVATLREWLIGFPFATEADFANAIALFLLPFVRELCGPATPMHQIEAAREGTGKSLLARVLMDPSQDGRSLTLGLPPAETEVYKLLSYELFELAPVIFFDNVKGKVDSPALEAALTGATFATRTLGKAEIVQAPVRCTWIMTTNGVLMSPDLARRCVRIRLARKEENWNAEQAVHPDILGWTMANRSRLVSAALRLVAHWLENGRQSPENTLDGYETWSRTMSGILDAAGIYGFLEVRRPLVLTVERPPRDVLTVTWSALLGTNDGQRLRRDGQRLVLDGQTLDRTGLLALLIDNIDFTKYRRATPHDYDAVEGRVEVHCVPPEWLIDLMLRAPSPKVRESAG